MKAHKSQTLIQTIRFLAQCSYKGLEKPQLNCYGALSAGGSKSLTEICFLTVVVVSPQIFGVNVQIMISVQLPKLAVDDVKVFVGEVVSDLIDVVLFFQQGQSLKEITPA